MAGWSEGAHPRVPAGSPKGGEFTSKGGGPVRFSTANGGMTEDEVREFAKGRFHSDLTREDIAKMSGALPGSEVTIHQSGISSALEVNVTFMGDDGFPIGNARRTVWGEDIVNDEIEFDKAFRGKGLGLKVFAQQVEEASKRGYKKIETHAAGSPDMADIQNGYYTWARFGYNGTIDGPHGETTVHELMRTPGGAKWWQANGHEFDGEFDLSQGSDSRRVFEEYKRLKGL